MSSVGAARPPKMYTLTPCAHFDRSLKADSPNSLNCRGYLSSWKHQDKRMKRGWCWVLEARGQSQSASSCRVRPRPSALPAPPNRWHPAQTTSPRGLTFWWENGAVPTAGIVENKQKGSVNTDIWKFTQIPSQVPLSPTPSHYMKAYQLANSTHAHEAIRASLLNTGTEPKIIPFL